MVSASRHQADVDADLNSVAALGEPVRRTLYRYVAAQLEPVSREQAAAAVGVAHHTAKFHLDKLEDEGLLEVDYRRPDGRSGPGAGRPTKFYRRAHRDIALSLPERHYDVAGRVMAEALTAIAASKSPLAAALHGAGRRTGRQLGNDAERAMKPGASKKALIAAICDALEENGYQPSATPRCITLTNCPFHSLAQEYTELVCGINLDVVTGLLDAFNQTTWRAQLDPAPGRCCVTISHSQAARSKDS